MKYYHFHILVKVDFDVTIVDLPGIYSADYTFNTRMTTTFLSRRNVIPLVVVNCESNLSNKDLEYWTRILQRNGDVSLRAFLVISKSDKCLDEWDGDEVMYQRLDNLKNFVVEAGDVFHRGVYAVYNGDGQTLGQQDGDQIIGDSEETIFFKDDQFWSTFVKDNLPGFKNYLGLQNLRPTIEHAVSLTNHDEPYHHLCGLRDRWRRDQDDISGALQGRAIFQGDIIRTIASSLRESFSSTEFYRPISPYTLQNHDNDPSKLLNSVLNRFLLELPVTSMINGDDRLQRETYDKVDRMIDSELSNRPSTNDAMPFVVRNLIDEFWETHTGVVSGSMLDLVDRIGKLVEEKFDKAVSKLEFLRSNDPEMHDIRQSLRHDLESVKNSIVRNSINPTLSSLTKIYIGTSLTFTYTLCQYMYVDLARTSSQFSMNVVHYKQLKIQAYSVMAEHLYRTKLHKLVEK